MLGNVPKQEDNSERHGFTTTQWGVVLDAAHADPSRVRLALEKLCGRYWYPVYAFIRQRGYDPHQAEDLAQGYFEFVLERQVFQKASPHKGRFRSFLLASLTNYLHNKRDEAGAKKRGGHLQFVSLDEQTAEEWLSREPTLNMSPEIRFDRHWAQTLIRTATDQLRGEYQDRDKLQLFEALQPHLTRISEGNGLELLARELGMESGAARVALHRARRRFGELLRGEVAQTVQAPEEVEEEIRHLLAEMGDIPE